MAGKVEMILDVKEIFVRYSLALNRSVGAFVYSFCSPHPEGHLAVL